MISGNLAEAVEWFAAHETDRRGIDGTAYEQMKRDFNLSFAEAVRVCREVRKLVGPYPATGGVSTSKRAIEPRPLG
ncbi:hypothetical protein [Mesorhizobium sp. M1D.F.Ca.ET.043.01.1.1]|uniref:hypothetical protein n=1 Tax=Mesorhizobium sp. M1D.F.Ca.ET.043.01.1.1 TaxID=2493669 RepID=UPI000F7611C7|nr:hypothetical protein [Mesorhizobium sp. M1D.F.Ca.ET.043.01.1.1]AZO75023.1 hypothetical protein EJ067_30515 [Mesorhizobium sp. M1D.F.Ca.ET.043.01.1.1]